MENIGAVNPSTIASISHDLIVLENLFTCIHWSLKLTLACAQTCQLLTNFWKLLFIWVLLIMLCMTLCSVLYYFFFFIMYVYFAIFPPQQDFTSAPCTITQIGVVQGHMWSILTWRLAISHQSIGYAEQWADCLVLTSRVTIPVGSMWCGCENNTACSQCI